MSALSIEYAAVQAHLVDLHEEEDAVGTVYEVGTFGERELRWTVCLGEVGAGNAGAAASVERALLHFRPTVALFVGVAGGIKDVAIGDVVAATKIYGYESGKEGTTGLLPRPDVGISAYRLIQRARAEARKGQWYKTLCEVDMSSLPRVFVAPIAAGEKIVASSQSQTAKFLREHYGDALAVEMEGAGFLRALHAHIDTAALVVRGISDLLSGKAKADSAGSQQVASRNAAAFAMAVLAGLGVAPRAHELPVPEKRERVARKAEKMAASTSMIYGGLGWWTGDRLACFSRRWPSESALDSVEDSPLALELAKKFVGAHLDDLSFMFCCGPLPEIVYGTYFGLDCAARQLIVDVNHFRQAAHALDGTLFKEVPILTDQEAFALLCICVAHARNIVEADCLAHKPFSWQNVDQLYEHVATKTWGSESLAPLYTAFFRCLEEFLAVDSVCSTPHFGRNVDTMGRNNNDLLRTLYATKYLPLGPDAALVRWSNAVQIPVLLAPSTTTLPLAARLTAAIIVTAFDQDGKKDTKLPLPVAAACDAIHSALVDVYRSLVTLVATRLPKAAIDFLLISRRFTVTIDGVEVTFDSGGAVIPESLSDMGEILIDAACAEYSQRIAGLNLPPRVTLYDVLRYFLEKERCPYRRLLWIPHKLSFANRLRIATRIIEPIFSLCVVADPPPFLR
ncbi:MAG: 5'-methylthioadenosine/S-adenosylhomocysteine nucleosidase [Deltaproteobacteria bacterium]|nr:5'-methylthioadenosine/S-adenosylhomocysteine nucleosidase [Deltaproteobacteria bacterium]